MTKERIMLTKIPEVKYIRKLTLALKLFVKMGHPTSHLLPLGMHMSTKFISFSKFTLSLLN